MFTRSAGVWTQQGEKLVGTGGAGALQGSSVSLSSDGNTAIVGGYNDNNTAGAAWVYVATACRVSRLAISKAEAPRTFHGGITATAIWLMNGTQVLTSPVIASVAVEWHIVGIGD